LVVIRKLFFNRRHTGSPPVEECPKAEVVYPTEKNRKITSYKFPCNGLETLA
jgi:hypothetical protein